MMEVNCFCWDKHIGSEKQEKFNNRNNNQLSILIVFQFLKIFIIIMFSSNLRNLLTQRERKR